MFLYASEIAKSALKRRIHLLEAFFRSKLQGIDLKFFRVRKIMPITWKTPPEKF